MALGFKKSLLGYNCEEVSSYIHKTAQENKELVASLNNKIKESNKLVEVKDEQCQNLSNQITELNDQLNFYKAKYEEVKKLSENIGKLYLVAQTNAKAIISAANDASTLAQNEMQSNISLIEQTDTSLLQLKSDLLNISNNFVIEVDKLQEKLNAVKNLSKIAETEQNEKTENFDAVYNSLKK